MPPCDPEIPIVAIHNNLETFFKFLSRAEDPALFQKRKYRGDRGLFWLGDPKLLFVTAPIPGAEIICRRWGYPGTIAAAPSHPTHQLCQNILDEPELIERIVSHAGAGRTVQMVPYAATTEFFSLVEALRARYGLTVLLPESPAADKLWLRDYADTKSGFRSLLSQHTGALDAIPHSFICRDLVQAAGAVEWFLGRGRACVVKADDGESGIGHVIFWPEPPLERSVLQILERNPFLKGGILIVDLFIDSPQNISPSLEFFVPPIGAGSPQITYLSQQLFSGFGRFAGVLISRNLEKAYWYPTLKERGQKIAELLQTLGYVGHFDLDAVVDENMKPYLLEINTRRTGGTYVHEFACHTFGPDYLQRVALLSINALDSGGIVRIEELLDRLSDLLFPDYAADSGVVITVTSTLPAGEFGCILVAPDEAQIDTLNAALAERLQTSRVAEGKV